MLRRICYFYCAGLQPRYVIKLPLRECLKNSCRSAQLLHKLHGRQASGDLRVQRVEKCETQPVPVIAQHRIADTNHPAPASGQVGSVRL